ncbi:MAG: helix-turn-helix domain-containing protein [Limnoraphis robusta]|jgi:AraC family transcriptional regulator
MTNILMMNENPETQKLLIQCLKTAGFDVISTENGLVRVRLAQEKFSTPTKSKPSNLQEFMFPSIPRLREVFEFIELNYHQNIRLKEVAQAVGYSSAYLTDLVRQLTGKTVNNWIIERRIAEARRLLLETEDSIEQIALKVGYQNLNHFYSQFRNYHRTTPRSWRESQRYQLA